VANSTTLVTSLVAVISEYLDNTVQNSGGRFNSHKIRHGFVRIDCHLEVHYAVTGIGE
jgi:hypothetical protein